MGKTLNGCHLDSKFVNDSQILCIFIVMCTGAWVARRRERAEQTEKALEYPDIESVIFLQLGQQRTERVQEKAMIFCTTGILKLTANRAQKIKWTCVQFLMPWAWQSP